MTATVGMLVLLALGVVLATAPSPAIRRVRTLRPAQDGPVAHPRRPAVRIRGGVLVPSLCGAAAMGAWSRAGFGVELPVLPATAGLLAAGTAALVLSDATSARRRVRVAMVLVESVGALSADLRAGQHPADALAALGDDARSADAVRQHPAVAAVWRVSGRSGAPAATVLDRIEQDLRARADQQREVGAQLAGARSTATLLAVLPLLGISLGVAMGARPLEILLGTPTGQVALVVGTGLEALGVFWTSRIVAAAEGPR